MKLRNKKTGEIFDALIREKGGGGSYSLIVCDIKAYEQSKSSLEATHFVIDEYDSLADLNEEWEDYEEPRYFWYIDDEGNVESCIRNDELDKPAKEIGNYFETKEEAEKAVEKLKAWKRLKDKGVKVKDFYKLNECSCVTHANFDENWNEIYHDLQICFGGEE